MHDATDGYSYYFTSGGTKTKNADIAYTALYATATITLDKISLTSDGTHAALDADAFKPYADTYNFEAAVTGQARIGDTEPTNYATVASRLDSADIAVNVTINSSGEASLSKSSVFYGMEGDDDNVADPGNEAGTISIKVAD